MGRIPNFLRHDRRLRFSILCSRDGNSLLFNSKTCMELQSVSSFNASLVSQFVQASVVRHLFVFEIQIHQPLDRAQPKSSPDTFFNITSFRLNSFE